MIQVTIFSPSSPTCKYTIYIPSICDSEITSLRKPNTSKNKSFTTILVTFTTSHNPQLFTSTSKNNIFFSNSKLTETHHSSWLSSTCDGSHPEVDVAAGYGDIRTRSQHLCTTSANKRSQKQVRRTPWTEASGLIKLRWQVKPSHIDTISRSSDGINNTIDWWTHHMLIAPQLGPIDTWMDGPIERSTATMSLWTRPCWCSPTAPFCAGPRTGAQGPWSGLQLLVWLQSHKLALWMFHVCV